MLSFAHYYTALWPLVSKIFKKCFKNISSFLRYNVWFMKIRITYNLSLWLHEYFWIILLYGHLVYFILKSGHEKFAMWNEDLPEKSQIQFMYGHGSNFYESDVTSIHFSQLVVFTTMNYSVTFLNFNHLSACSKTRTFGPSFLLEL